MGSEKIFFKVRHWPEWPLARRIAALLYDEDWAEYDTMARKWQIGRGNDFWLHQTGDKTYSLHCRLVTPEEKQALAVMLEWRLRVELIKEE